MEFARPWLHDAAMTADRTTGFTDIDRRHWSLRYLPPWVRPYGRLARWDRPIGIWLLMLPCWWSLALGAAPEWGRLAGWMALFALGALVMRGAGCTWNDIVDRKVDARVERTRGRPLPSGEVTLRNALVWMVLQSLVGVAILFKFNKFAGGVALASLLLVAIYPTMKRLTSWPQVVLGLAFNWGALVGYAAVTGALSWATFALCRGAPALAHLVRRAGAGGLGAGRSPRGAGPLLFRNPAGDRAPLRLADRLPEAAGPGGLPRQVQGQCLDRRAADRRRHRRPPALLAHAAPARRSRGLHPRQYRARSAGNGAGVQAVAGQRICADLAGHRGLAGGTECRSALLGLLLAGRPGDRALSARQPDFGRRPARHRFCRRLRRLFPGGGPSGRRLGADQRHRRSLAGRGPSQRPGQ